MTEPLLNLTERGHLERWWRDAGCPTLTDDTIEGKGAEIANLIVEEREVAYRALANAILNAGNRDTPELAAARLSRRSARVLATVAQRDLDNAKGTHS